MTTEVIILCQGTQQRLGMEHGYKQLLPLPACNGAQILLRTLTMLMRMHKSMGDPVKVTVIGWPEMFAQRWWPGRLSLVTMPDPGNSSLKGIARYLESRDSANLQRTMVLLGDVVYSWACLAAIRASATVWGYGFTGTSDLRADGGELWGVGWDRFHEDHMMATLREALQRHPPFDEYQPGQMRRWLQHASRHPLAPSMMYSITESVVRLRDRFNYAAVDDYTMDVDLPDHIPQLVTASEAAARDDLAHGLAWDSPCPSGDALQ